MKSVLLTLLILFISQGAYAQVFTIDDKGIVKCPTAKVGDKGRIFGVEYEAISGSDLKNRVVYNGNLYNICTSLVTNMSRLFDNKGYNNYDNAQQPSIGHWDVSNVTEMDAMFHASGFNQPIGNWDVSNVITMSFMFAHSKFNQPIGDWDVSNVTSMSAMFYNSMFNQPIGDWDVSNVTSMSVMFSSTIFNHDLSRWNTSKVTLFSSMFANSVFNLPISDWDVSSATKMSHMFDNSLFNQPIGNWSVHNVTNMDFMFFGSIFDQSINRWCVSNIKNEPRDFATNSPLKSNHKPLWGTCNGKPNKIVLKSPLNNSIDTYRKPNLIWEPDSNAASYRIQIFEGFDPIVLDTITTYNKVDVIATLKPNIDYYWKVQGINADGFRIGEWSDVWKFSTGTLTALDNESHPNGYTLAQNFPNPFNPTTQISFTLPRSASVRLEVFNSLGQPVGVIAEGQLPAGAHTYAFDGAALSSGVYLYRLTTPDFVQTRVMALVK